MSCGEPSNDPSSATGDKKSSPAKAELNALTPVGCSAWLACGVWYSLKDAVPPTNKSLLLYHSGHETTDWGLWTGKQWETGGGNLPYNTPTHFLMLPSLPGTTANQSNEHLAS